MIILESFKVVNYKNFKEINLSNISSLSVLIGANGAGKSNFLSIIDFISNAFNSGIDVYFNMKGINFQDCIHQWNLDNKMSIDLGFREVKLGSYYKYKFTLEYNKKNSFSIVGEEFTDTKSGISKSYNSSERTHLLLTEDNVVSKEEVDIKNFLSNVESYSFYSIVNFNSKMSSEDKNKLGKLKSNAENMPSLLYVLKSKYPVSYRRIVDTVKLAINSFVDFYFIEEGNKVNLKFKMSTSSHPLSIRSLSDGTLRFIILVLLLNLPIEVRPSLILLEEPEVSLHPSVINLLGDLIDSYSKDSQIMVATQSPYLLDRIAVDKIYVLQINHKAETEVKIINKQEIAEWLKKYSLSDLWMMNVLGGGPV